MWRRLVKTIFFGNYFYAVCSVSLAIESNLQLHRPVNKWPFYLMLFFGTVVYYTKAYITKLYINSSNIRTVWYGQHLHFIQQRQYLFSTTAIVSALLYLLKYRHSVPFITAGQWVLLFIVPIVALLYYDLSLSGVVRFNLRKRGWLKPFVISFVWAGCVTIYPLVCSVLETKIPYTMGYTAGWFFFKNWIFIAVLCIMFDIKDYTSDANHQLKTFVVQIGERRTLLYIITPLTILIFFAFILFTWHSHFTIWSVAINSIPFLLMLIVAHSLHRQKSIMYYLVVIDGLMLVKGMCGIAECLLHN